MLCCFWAAGFGSLCFRFGQQGLAAIQIIRSDDVREGVEERIARIANCQLPHSNRRVLQAQWSGRRVWSSQLPHVQLDFGACLGTQVLTQADIWGHANVG